MKWTLEMTAVVYRKKSLISVGTQTNGLKLRNECRISVAIRYVNKSFGHNFVRLKQRGESCARAAWWPQRRTGRRTTKVKQFINWVLISIQIKFVFVCQILAYKGPLWLIRKILYRINVVLNYKRGTFARSGIKKRQQIYLFYFLPL